MAVSGNLGGKVPVVDDVLLSHQQETYPTTSVDENCIEFEFQIRRNYYTDLRQTYLALKMKFIKSRCYETYNAKEIKKEHEEAAKVDEETVAAEEEHEVPIPLVVHVNNILHSIYSNFGVYISNQQTYNSNGLYAHKLYFSNNFKGAISDHEGVLHCEGYNYEEFPDEIMEAPFSEPFHKNENA